MKFLVQSQTLEWDSRCSSEDIESFLSTCLSFGGLFPLISAFHVINTWVPC
jgi:hypothetical protein